MTVSILDSIAITAILLSVISVKNLTKYYGQERALDGVSFDIHQGDIVGFLGPNGAGKTTTMKILTGFLPYTSGAVRISGMDILEDSVSIRKNIGYLPENNPLYEDFQVGEYLRFLAEMHRIPAEKKRQRIKYVVEVCGLEDRVRMEIGTLSKGYRQRVGLAQALIHDPAILILDEPTSGLDPNQIVEIRSLIKEIGTKKTILLCTHILSEVEAACNRVIIIHKGKIAGEGTPSELRGQAQEHAVIQLEVKGAVNDVTALLKNVTGVLAVHKKPSDERGVCFLSIETAKDQDIRPLLNHALLDNGFELLGMMREDATMEDVFSALTRS